MKGSMHASKIKETVLPLQNVHTDGMYGTRPGNALQEVPRVSWNPSASRTSCIIGTPLSTQSSSSIRMEYGCPPRNVQSYYRQIAHASRAAERAS